MIFYPMARAKIWRAHLRARQMCAQHTLLRKIQNLTFFLSKVCCAHIWRAPSDKTSSKQYFMYLQLVHIFKTRGDRVI